CRAAAWAAWTSKSSHRDMTEGRPRGALLHSAWKCPRSAVSGQQNCVAVAVVKRRVGHDRPPIHLLKALPAVEPQSSLVALEADERNALQPQRTGNAVDMLHQPAADAQIAVGFVNGESRDIERARILKLRIGPQHWIVLLAVVGAPLDRKGMHHSGDLAPAQRHMAVFEGEGR